MPETGNVASYAGLVAVGTVGVGSSLGFGYGSELEFGLSVMANRVQHDTFRNDPNDVEIRRP